MRVSVLTAVGEAKAAEVYPAALMRALQIKASIEIVERLPAYRTS